MDYTYHYDSPLGGMTMASDGEALTGLWFDGQEHETETLRAAGFSEVEMMRRWENTCTLLAKV